MSGKLATNEVLEQFNCWECGILFAVPSRWARDRFKNEGTIKCPNGHDYGCVWKDEEDAKELEAENERLRREIMQVRHDADQAEARLRDERPNAKESTELPDVSEPHELAARPKVDASGCLLCPDCGKTYRSTQWLGWHLKRKHAYTEERVLCVVKAALAEGAGHANR